MSEQHTAMRLVHFRQSDHPDISLMATVHSTCRQCRAGEESSDASSPSSLLTSQVGMTSPTSSVWLGAVTWRMTSWPAGWHRALTWSVVLCCWALLCVAGVGAEQVFRREPESVSVTRGRVVLLHCSIANRVGAVQWTQNGVALGAERSLPGYPRYSMIGTEVNQTGGGRLGEWNLQISDVRLEDDGNYECQAGSTHTARGIRSRTAAVTVVIPPEQPTIDGAPTIPVVLHRPTNVTCRANNGKPAADITWYMDGQRVTHKVYTRSHPRPDHKFVDTVGMVTINASKADSGRRVECRAINRFMERPFITFATLDVQYAPEISLRINLTRTIREYDYVRFSCSGLANPADITWRWFRNNREVDGETGSTLTIPQISHDYNGDTIACTAANSVGRSRKEMTLTVEYGPRLTEVDVVVGADLQGPAELRCQADGNPQPHVLWTRKDSGSPGAPRTLSTSTLFRIEHVTPASFGVYTCTASTSGFPDVSKEVLLLQNGKPSIRSEKQQYAARGEKGQLECIARSVPKPDRMVWLREGQPIDLDDSSGRFSAQEKDLLYGRSSVLHIFSVRKEDFGNYNCNVINAYGSDNVTLTLVEKTVPPLPYIIGGVVGGVAVLFIIAVACVLYQRYKREDAGSIVGSTTDTDSSGDKKRKDADSPSTLMDQWRQDYNKPKDFYRHSADYDELNYKDHTGNNNAYGCLEPSDPYRDSFPAGDYSRALSPLDRYEAVYGPPGFNMSSFRGREQPDRLDTNPAKLATDV
ncbi:kin of IRRE-like protein 1 [Babylonia areolata]|uniref:kin of IRRE-like protein 1 n=1 Tax=Babylonia areolata TaxID=304850 RepID=UPI003FCFE2AD